MDGAGRSKFTVNQRIAAVKTFFTHINVVFHAFITGFPIWVIHTDAQSGRLLKYCAAPAFLLVQALWKRHSVHLQVYQLL